MSGSQNIEYASILSKSETSTSLVKPSIFDIIAQENMHSLFRPSFSHLLKWMSLNFPRLSRLKPYSEEIYLLLHSSIEFLYLKAYNSLFSEYFYGLKRDGLNNNNNNKRLLSILFSIVIPYLKAKMDDFYEELEKSVDSPDFSGQQYSNKFKKILSIVKTLYLKLFPYFHTTWSLLFWYYRFKFLINKSEYNSPLLSILGLKLVYDVDRHSFDSPINQSLLKNFLLFFNNCFTNILFFIQFLKWYQDYTQNQTYTGQIDPFLTPISLLLGSKNDQDLGNSEELLPAPKLPEKLLNNKIYKILKDKSLCPICSKKRTNECVLSVSGFVFCYPCIFKFIKEHQRCPLTNFPCTTKNIIRIYATE